MARKLTLAERHILQHPPTPTTWECGRQRKVMEIGPEGTPVVVVYVCKGIVPGSYTYCTFCRLPKPRGAKLLWPTYLAACAVADHAPGARWQAEAIATPTATRQKPIRRKGA